MLQVNNLEGKPDWINETQFIIPIVDNEEISQKEIGGMTKHTITLNGFESGDQTLLGNGSSQTFVIGLDQGLFENYSSKSDMLLMSNSDLKLIPTVSDPKSTYASVDNSKSEIAWENSAFEKPLAKDILNVIHDTSKNWQDVGKNGDICLDEFHTVDSKLNANFLIESHVVQSKKLRTGGSDQYIVGYYPVVEACDTVLVPASLMTLQQKKVGNEKPTGKNISSTKNLSQLFENIEGAQTNKWMKSGAEEEGKTKILKMTNIQEDPLILPQDNITDTVIPLLNSTRSDFIYAKSKNDNNDDTEKCLTKDEKLSTEVSENENNTLLEQSLPLKKKAKMKKSPISGSLIFPSGDTAANGCHVLHNTEVKENEERNTSENNRDLEELKKKRKSEVSKKEKGWCNYQRNETNQSEIHYDNITQLLEHLKNEKYINESIFKILCAGLQEMDVDILDEMYKKRGSKCPDYSSHLKAFAFMLHFKQPMAFNRLGELFQSGWPPLSVIKEWKRRLNNHRKPRNIK